MKVHSDRTGTHWEAETPVEGAAIRYVNKHVPIVPFSEIYGIHAFEAGAKWQGERLANLSDQADQDLRVALSGLSVEKVTKALVDEYTEADLRAIRTAINNTID